MIRYNLNTVLDKFYLSIFSSWRSFFDIHLGLNMSVVLTWRYIYLDSSRQLVDTHFPSTKGHSYMPALGFLRVTQVCRVVRLFDISEIIRESLMNIHRLLAAPLPAILQNLQAGARAS